MAIVGVRAYAVGAAALLGVPILALSILAVPAYASTCPTVASNGVVTPAPAPGVDWSGCNLSNAAMQNADLSGANLSSANLTGAQLSGANLSGASLGNAIATNTNFSGADLTGASAGAAFSGSDLAGVNLQNADLSNAIMTDVSSGGVTGTPVALPYQVELMMGYLVGQWANLSGAKLSGANLANLRLDNANFTHADVSSADLSGAVLDGADLNYANLTSANLTNANLTSANLQGAILQGTVMAGASLGAVIAGPLSGTPASLPANWSIGGASLFEYLLGPSAVLSQATLGNSDLAGADLAGATLENAIFVNSNLTDVNLSSADLQWADFTGAKLTGADLTGANLNGATWSSTTCPDGSLSEQHAPDGCTTPLDTIPPVAAPAVVVGAAGSDGWYHSAVTVAWNWTDDGTIDQANCTQASVTSGQGTAVTVSASCSDMNANTGTASYRVKVDTTPPAVSVTGVVNARRYILGAVPKPGCATTDNLSGVAMPASVHVTTTGSHGVGLFKATCSGATDVAGNTQAQPVTASYTVVYGFGGFSAPKPGTRLLKSARTITVTFRLVNAAGQPISSSAASALASAHGAEVALTGPGITKKTATCTWQSTTMRFRCLIRTPAGVETGSSHKYLITALENVGTGWIRVPVVGSAINPEAVYFK